VLVREDSADKLSMNASAIKDKTMATMALPLRELSVTVQAEAVSAQMAYWRLREDVAQRHAQVFVWVKTRALNHAMGRLVEKQQSLIDTLSKASTMDFDADVFLKIANDLDNVVSLTNSFIDEAYEMPSLCLRVWSERLEKISDLNRYVDNFAESFHIASDEACTALLADIAAKVTADALVSSR
jgi:hypothetical protein